MNRYIVTSSHRSPGFGFWISCLTLLAFLAVTAQAAPSKITRSEIVEFYATAGHLSTNADGQTVWRLPVQVHVFSAEDRGLAVGMMKGLLGFKNDEMTDAEQKLCNERVCLFVVDNKDGKRVAVQVAGQTMELGPTSGVGQSGRYVTFTPEQLAGFRRSATNGPDQVIIMADTNHTRGRMFSSAVQLIEPQGWSVISDIDDTIKITEVLNHKAALQNTFCRPFKAVEGMGSLYRDWANQGKSSFFYVTGSPRQLYQPLRDFLATNGFPSGVFHMREFNLGNTTVFNLLKSPEKYKIRELSAILAEFPNRKYILVGDSGEKDPEVYSTMAREHPEAIQYIFIRDVTNEPADSDRYRMLFEGVPREKWRIFKEPTELKDVRLK